MILVILAAGLGSRFGGLKQAEPIDDFGNFLIDYSVFDAIRAGATKVIFILREENFEHFKSTIGKRVENFVCTEYVFQDSYDITAILPDLSQRKKPFGTAHAIMKLKGKVKENFAVINADDFYGRKSFSTMAESLKYLTESDFCSVCFEAKNTLSSNGAVKRGVCLVDDGFLTNIEECEITSNQGTLQAKSLESGKICTLPQKTLVSMNMFGFTPKIFEILDEAFPRFIEELKENPSAEFFLPAAITSAIKNKSCRMKVLPSAENWMGLTYRDDLFDVRKKISKLIDDGEYPKNLWGQKI